MDMRECIEWVQASVDTTADQTCSDAFKRIVDDLRYFRDTSSIKGMTINRLEREIDKLKIKLHQWSEHDVSHEEAKACMERLASTETSPGGES